MKKPAPKSIHIQKLKALHKRNWLNVLNMPPHTYGRGKAFSQKNANEVTKAICEYINLRGGVATRINNGAVYDKKRGQYRKGSVTKGVPDIDATFAGRPVKIEVKFGADRMSDDQLALKARYEAAGAIYIVARTFDTFWDDFTAVFGVDPVEFAG